MTYGGDEKENGESLLGARHGEVSIEDYYLGEKFRGKGEDNRIRGPDPIGCDKGENEGGTEEH